MTNDWLKKLLSDQRPQRLPEALLHVKGDPKWEGDALHVILKNEDGITAKVGHIYPGAEWVVSARENHKTVHIKLFAQDARHYINLFNQAYPDRAISDQPPERQTESLPDSVEHALYALASNLEHAETVNHHFDGQPFQRVRVWVDKSFDTAASILMKEYPGMFSIVESGPKASRFRGQVVISLRGQSLIEAFNTQHNAYLRRSDSVDGLEARTR